MNQWAFLHYQVHHEEQFMNIALRLIKSLLWAGVELMVRLSSGHIVITPVV